MLRRVTELVLCAGVLFPAYARANDCQPVADAYDALSKTPGYRQTVLLNGSLLAEFIAVGDKLYTKQDTGWSVIDLGAGGRVTMQKAVIPNAESLKDCARIGPDVIAGRNAMVYGYTPPPVAGAGELGPQRVWIGVADGLPLKMTSQQSNTDVTLSFDNVTAPIR